MQINIAIKDEDVTDMLKEISRRTQSMEPVMRTIGETVKRSIQKTFDAGGRPDKWPRSKRVKAEGGETLKLTGMLKNSINVDYADDHSVAVGTSDQRATTHHFGAKKGSFGTVMANVKAHIRIIEKAFGRELKFPVAVNVDQHTRQMELPWGDIPARKFMMLQDEDWEEIKRELARYLTAGRR